jgi:hypothetical protein
VAASGIADGTASKYARIVSPFLLATPGWRDATLRDLVAFALTQSRPSAHITTSALRSFYAYAAGDGARNGTSHATVPRQVV